MNKNSDFDQLHALADGQLDSREREEVLAILDKDAELRGEMCDIYRIKDLVQTAYPLDEFKPAAGSGGRSGFNMVAKAASFLLAVIVSLAAGYMLGEKGEFNPSESISLANTKVQDNKVILFLSSAEPNKFIKALSRAETLAKKYQKTDGKVSVVTSAEGINLLRLKTSPYKNQIKKLTNLYSSLNFIACNNTLYQFKKAGKTIELIDSAKVAPSAVKFVVEHLQKGWRYIPI